MDAVTKELISALCWFVGSSLSGAILSQCESQIYHWRERMGALPHTWDVTAKRTIYDFWLVGTVFVWVVSLIALVNSILFN